LWRTGARGDYVLPLALTIDPLAESAQQQEQLRQRLTELAPPLPPELEAAWQAAAEACLEPPKWKRLDGEGLEEQWYVLVTSGMRNSRWSCWGGSRGRGRCARRC